MSSAPRSGIDPMKGGPPADASAAAGGPGGVLGASITQQRSQAVRMNLFVLVRILFQYLERVDKDILDLAKEVSIFIMFPSLLRLYGDKWQSHIFLIIFHSIILLVQLYQSSGSEGLRAEAQHQRLQVRNLGRCNRLSCP